MLRLLCAIAVMLFVAPASAQTFDFAYAASGELESACRRDRGALWGVELCAPLLVVDPASRRVWASQADGDGSLRPGGDGWSGTLPEGVPIANSSLDWAGVRWIMVMAPLPESPEDRRVLILREAWHQVQARLGLPAASADCVHLATARARTLLRLEMRALASALRSNGRARSQASQEALIFRAARLAEFPGAAASEAALDRNEGLAAYTGVRLGAATPETYAARTLDRYDQQDSYIRTYAFATGPAYGLLLDQLRPRWRDEARTGAAAADLLAASVRPDPLTSRRLQEASDRYGAAAVAAQEAAHVDNRREQLTTLRAQFSTQPRLEVALLSPRFEFDPGQITAIEGLGSFYAALVVRDDWGEARATSGAMLNGDRNRLVLAAPGADGRSGPGWALRLAEGYRIAGPGPDGVFWIEAAAPAP